MAHFFNKIIYLFQEFMRKDDLNVHVFQYKNWCSPKSDRWFFFLTLTVRGRFHRKDSKWKKIWVHRTMRTAIVSSLLKSALISCAISFYISSLFFHVTLYVLGKKQEKKKLIKNKGALTYQTSVANLITKLFTKTLHWSRKTYG